MTEGSRARVVLPKLPVDADVILTTGEKVRGTFFVAPASAHRPGPETLLELLNEDARSFVPFQSEEGMLLLNRTTIRLVSFASPELLQLFSAPDNENIYGITLVLSGDAHKITGYCHTGDLRPETRRPIDLLNSSEVFLLVYSERLMLINKTAISHASL